MVESKKVVKEGDFVKINYTGYIKDTNEVIDTTLRSVGKDYNLSGEFEPVVVIAGKRYLIKGVDDALLGMKEGEKKKVVVEAKDGFGERKPELVKTFSMRQFAKSNRLPKVGDTVKVGNIYGRVVSINGGRIRVDFNHPLAGKTLIYELEVLEIIEKDEEKIKGLVAYHAMIPIEKLDVQIENNKAKINLGDYSIGEGVAKLLEEEIKKNLKNIDAVEFKTSSPGESPIIKTKKKKS